MTNQKLIEPKESFINKFKNYRNMKPEISEITYNKILETKKKYFEAMDIFDENGRYLFYKDIAPKISSFNVKNLINKLKTTILEPKYGTQLRFTHIHNKQDLKDLNAANPNISLKELLYMEYIMTALMGMINSQHIIINNKAETGIRLYLRTRINFRKLKKFVIPKDVKVLKYLKNWFKENIVGKKNKKMLAKIDSLSTIIFDFISKEIQPYKSKREEPFVLSINPYDLYTISDDTTSWTSCMSISSGSISPLYYTTDDATMVVYSPNEKGLKKQRMLLHYDQLKKHIFCQREYPQTNYTVISEWQNVVIEKLQEIIHNTFQIESTILDYNQQRNTGARLINKTWKPYIDPTSAVIKNTRNDLTDLNVTNSLICIECGEQKEIYSHDKMLCIDCYDQSFCRSCGHKYTEENPKADFPSEGGNMCQRCFELAYFTCEECGETHARYSSYTIKNGKTVCRICLNKLTDYCEECGKRHLKTEMKIVEERVVCEECIATCKDCGQTFLKRNTYYGKCKVKCSSAWKKKVARAKEKWEKLVEAREIDEVTEDNQYTAITVNMGEIIEHWIKFASLNSQEEPEEEE